MVVNVDLGDTGLAVVFGCQFVEHGAQHLAGAAPFSPEVHEDGLGGLDDLRVKILGGEGDDVLRSHDGSVAQELVCATNQYWTATAAIASSATAKARPTSRPLTPAERAGAGRGAAAGFAAGAAGAAAAAGAAVAGLDMAAGAAEAGEGGAGRAAAGAAGAAGAAAGAGVDAAAGAAAEGIRIDGPPAGLGGRLMRTVCFFCAASAGLGGSGVGAGGGTGLFSDIWRAFGPR